MTLQIYVLHLFKNYQAWKKQENVTYKQEKNHSKETDAEMINIGKTNENYFTCSKGRSRMKREMENIKRKSKLNS